MCTLFQNISLSMEFHRIDIMEFHILSRTLKMNSRSTELLKYLHKGNMGVLSFKLMLLTMYIRAKLDVIMFLGPVQGH